MDGRFDDIARHMEDVILSKQGVPGCDILIMQNHKPLYRYLCGYSDKEEKIPLRKDQLYYMYSCTKPMTVTAGMRLYEEGKLDFDRPVSDYLPAFRNMYLTRDGQTVPAKNTLTVRHLFTMTGGFDYTLHTPETDEVLKNGKGLATTRDVVDTFAARTLNFEPGAEFRYSVCHDILAAVIEVASDMRFSEYMDKVIFSPLGMADTGFKETPEIRERIASQYLSDANGSITKTEKENCFRLSENYESGGAGLISSVEDYAIFADTMACGGLSANGYRLLKEETVKLLHTEQLHTFVMNNNFSCAAGPGYGYGFGVRTRVSHTGGKSPIGEFGWDGAAGAYVMMDDVNRLSIFFGMQVRNWPACIGPGHAVMRDMMYTALGL